MSSIVVRTVADVRSAVRSARCRGESIGLVPTMGALHAGHTSLIRAARQETGFVVLSLFVNPTQFGPNEDFLRYPRPFERDLAICEREGVDVVFAPEPATIYPADYHTYVEVADLQDVLCGASRPGHFRGVCTVVLKLFNMVAPDLAYFGQKDAQQVVILQQMVRDLNVPVGMRVCPIVREPDGLALSSRNQYLSSEDRRQAVALYHALTAAGERVRHGEREGRALRQSLVEHIAATPGAALDYAAVVDAHTLQPVARLQGLILLALAVRFAGTRLIDNLVLNVTASEVREVAALEPLN